MPTLPSPGCRAPGCTQRQSPGQRYCPTHQRERWRALDRERGNSAQRGYDADWRRFREWFLAKYPLCADCREHGRTTLAVEVHHLRKIKDAPHLRLVEDACLPLCKRCHSLRTRRGE